MRDLPEGIESGDLIGALAGGWGFDAVSAEYAAVGAGSYHWVVSDRGGARRFVTVDDLRQKTWFGDTSESAFEGIQHAFDTAAALCAAGLAFVVAPLPASRGETVRRLGPHHTIALYPFVAGETAPYGHYGPGMREAIFTMLAALHGATPAVASLARTSGLELPGRRHVEAALRDAHAPWSGGPFSEPARLAFAARASDVAELLALADRFAARVERRGGDWVVTHGEPHSANVMRAGEGYVLVDWDTVALAPPERDLWMLVEDGTDEAAAYGEATGHRLDEDALSFFRLTWDLKDLAEYLNVLRAPHPETADTARAYEGVRICVAIRERWAALLG